MKLREMRALDEKGLLDKVDELKRDLLHLRLKASLGQLGNVREIRKVKKQVAQVLTLLNELQTKGKGAA